MTPPIKKNLNPRKNRRRMEFSFIHNSFLTFFSEIFRKNLKEGENLIYFIILKHIKGRNKWQRKILHFHLMKRQ